MFRIESGIPGWNPKFLFEGPILTPPRFTLLYFWGRLAPFFRRESQSGPRHAKPLWHDWTACTRYLFALPLSCEDYVPIISMAFRIALKIDYSPARTPVTFPSQSSNRPTTRHCFESRYIGPGTYPPFFDTLNRLNLQWLVSTSACKNTLISTR
jgi:hypothetical protein